MLSALSLSKYQNLFIGVWKLWSDCNFESLSMRGYGFLPPQKIWGNNFFSVSGSIFMRLLGCSIKHKTSTSFLPNEKFIVVYPAHKFRLTLSDNRLYRAVSAGLGLPPSFRKVTIVRSLCKYLTRLLMDLCSLPEQTLGCHHKAPHGMIMAYISARELQAPYW